MDRVGIWLNPANILQVSIRGPSFVEVALKNAPKFLTILVIVHVLAFFLLVYGARLLKKLRRYDSGWVRETKRRRNRVRN